MLNPICRLDSGHIYDIVFRTLRGRKWAVAKSPLAVAALNLLLLSSVLQQCCVVSTHNATHVGHTFIGNFNCVSIKKFSEWVVLGERCVDDSQELLAHVGFDS